MFQRVLGIWGSSSGRATDRGRGTQSQGLQSVAVEESVFSIMQNDAPERYLILKAPVFSRLFYPRLQTSGSLLNFFGVKGHLGESEESC